MKSQCYAGKARFTLTISLIKSVQKPKSANRTDYSSEKVSAIREKWVLHWQFYPKSQCKKRDRAIALTFHPKKSVLLEKSEFCTDNSIHKVSVKGKIQNLHWRFFPESQCYSEKASFALTFLSKESVQKAKLEICTDYSPEKVSAFREKWVLHWQFLSSSQCF